MCKKHRIDLRNSFIYSNFAKEKYLEHENRNHQAILLAA